MLQPKNKYVKKAIGTGKKVAKASAVGLALNTVPGLETIYDMSNIYEGLKEGDYKKIGQT